MFLYDCWYVVAWRDQVRQGELMKATLLNQPIVLYRGSDRNVVALADRCPHRLAPLSLGRVEGDALRCMYHGIKFGADGQCLEVPGQDRIPGAMRVRRYPVVESGCWVWIWMGDPRRADLALLPPGLISRTDPDWVVAGGQIDYEANYELINDNLLDLSHISFVHANTIARNSLQWGETRPEVRELKRGVRVERWLVNDPVPVHVAESPDVRLDRWTGYDFLAPGVFLLTSKYYPLGTAQNINFVAPAADPHYQNMTQQAVTPITHNTSIYYYTCGHRVQDTCDGRIERQLASVEKAFAEDRVLIEAQQLVIQQSPGAQMLATTNDGAVIRFRRIMKRLIKEQELLEPGEQVLP